MSSVNIPVLSWHRFKSRFLYISPEVVGKRHKFSNDGREVTLSLPTLDALTPRDELMKLAPHEEPLLFYDSWTIENGEEHPIGYWVGSVDITVNYESEIKIPKEILKRPPNAYDLLSKRSQQRLNRIAGEQKDIADSAFDHWLRVIRWKSNNFLIGRQKARGDELSLSWSTYLLNKNNHKRFWAGERILTVATPKAVTLREWTETGKLLRKGVKSPIYFDYYFDGLEHCDLQDLDRCVLDLAISCEAVMRGHLKDSLPLQLSRAIANYIDSVNIHNYIDRFVPDLFRSNKRTIFNQIKKDIKDLFHERNSIVHGKKVNSLSHKDCRRFIEATQKLIKLFSQ